MVRELRSSGTQRNLRIKYKSGRVSTKAIFFNCFKWEHLFHAEHAGFSWVWWTRGLIVVTCSYICNGCMPVRAVCKPHSPVLKKRRSSFGVSVRAPTSRAGIPGSRPARSKNELGWCGPGGVTLIQPVFFLIKYFFI